MYFVIALINSINLIKPATVYLRMFLVMILQHCFVQWPKSSFFQLLWFTEPSFIIFEYMEH